MSEPNTKAYRYLLGTSEVTPDRSVQHAAGWMVGVVPLGYPDTFRFTNLISPAEAVRARGQFVVENDAVSVTTNSSKTTPYDSCQIMLRAGDMNYMGTVFPGDFIFVWMHHDRQRIQEVKADFLGKRPANAFDSGLKFLGRVEAVREHLRVVNPTSGTKEVVYLVSAMGFQEFSTKVYIVPFLTLTAKEGFFQLLIKQWHRLMGFAPDKAPGTTGVQNIVRAFLNLFMGTGPETIQTIEGASPNQAFLIPKEVGVALGHVTNERRAPTLKFTDTLSFIQGVQKYSTHGTGTRWNGLVPDLAHKVSKNVLQYKTPIECTGENVTYGMAWQDSPVWGILTQYTNHPINEIYTAMKVGPHGSIVPSLIMRQVPFSTEEFLNRPFDRGGAKGGRSLASRVTLFMNLPRWVPDPSMVISHDLGRSNALRVNYVQAWGEMAGGPGIDGNTDSSSVAGFEADSANSYRFLQWNGGNYTRDDLDIRRSGLRSYVPTLKFDFAYGSSGKTLTKAPVWARWLGDWLINGHLKTNGKVTMTGVSEPIAVGDNFEWNGTVFHIEQVMHAAQISNATGQTSFRTTVTLSNGLDVRSGIQTIYPSMDNMYRETLAAQDRGRDGVYPGVTDVEVITDRSDGEFTETRVSPDFSRRPSTKKGGK